MPTEHQPDPLAAAERRPTSVRPTAGAVAPSAPDRRPLAAFAGTSRDEGRGTRQTIEDLGYGEEIVLRDTARPLRVQPVATLRCVEDPS